MDIKGLFVWILGSVIRVIQLISTLKKLFVSYFSITWIMTHWTQGNIISCLHQFYIYFPKLSNYGIARKHKWQKSEIYIRNKTWMVCVNGCSNQLFNGLISWITKVHLFVCQFLALLESTDQWYIFPNKKPLTNVKHIEWRFYYLH